MNYMDVFDEERNQAGRRAQRIYVAAHVKNISLRTPKPLSHLIDVASVPPYHLKHPVETSKKSNDSEVSAIAPSISPVIHPIRFL